MADMALITGVFTSLKAATEIAKFIRESDISLDKAETKMKLADLMSTLADIKMEMAEVQDELLKRDRSIATLQSQLSLKGKLVFEMPYYWLVDGQTKDGPFCATCNDKDNKQIRLISAKAKGLWSCNGCKNHFTDSHYVDSSSRYASEIRRERGF